MKTRYWLPSGDYNIILTKDELAKLVENGRLNMTTGRTECTSGRYYFDGESMQHAWKKEVFNELFFNLNEDDVESKDSGIHYVQFLNIIVE